MPDYRKTILEELGASLKNVKETEIAELAERILEAGKIFCDGLGRSRLVMQGFAMRLVQMGLKGVMVGEATAPAFENGDLLLICSASGSSETLRYHAGRAKECGGKVALITAKEQSPLTGYVSGEILIGAPDKDARKGEGASVQPMGTLFEQSAGLICDAVTLELMKRLELTSETMRKYHANIE